MAGDAGKSKDDASTRSHSKMNTASRFRCKVGGEWKQIDAFSNAQQKLLQVQLARGKPLNPAHCGMTCKDHTSGNRTELQCELCGLVKPIADFSKNSRRNGVYNCKRCMAWVETQEPDVTPAPLETGHISAEEVAGQVWTEKFNHDADFFVGNGKPLAPITTPESLGLEDLSVHSGLDIQSLIDQSVSSNASTTTSSMSGKTSRPPPHLRKRLQPSQPKSSPSVTSTSSAVAPVPPNLGKRLPPHLAHKAAASKTSSRYDETASSASLSTATTARNEQQISQQTRLTFNAWDANGAQHLAIHSDVTDLDSSSASVTSGCDDPDWGWNTVTRAKTPIKKGNARGKWPKASECRISQSDMRRQDRESTLVTRPPATETAKPRRTFYEPDDEGDEDI